MRAYHFLRADMTAGRGSEEPWALGEKRALKGGVLRLCERGYHSSPTPWAALKYAPGPVLCLVEIGGRNERDDTKQVSRSRRLLAAVNIERELRLFAADCAEQVLPLFEKAYPRDLRPRRALAAGRAFANGEISAAARSAAGAGAWAAAMAAARDAARDAAMAAARAAAWAAAWDAAVDAAMDAAWAAARDAAVDAAMDAAWDAAGAGAWAAARDAAWARQGETFNAMAYAALRVKPRR